MNLIYEIDFVNVDALTRTILKFYDDFDFDLNVDVLCLFKFECVNVFVLVLDFENVGELSAYAR